jgi:S-adenosylmethionine/arginine decarboxylase-like enzyme
MRTTRRQKTSPKVQHHHLLMRVELETCPHEEEKEKVREMISQIIKDIHMKNLAAPHVYYLKYPTYNEGTTAIAPIETSHIAFHFWNNPDKSLLHLTTSKCLLEFDIYTCGTLTTRDIGKVLHTLTYYRPTYMDITLLDRSRGLTINRHMHWNLNESAWNEWLKNKLFKGNSV